LDCTKRGGNLILVKGTEDQGCKPKCLEGDGNGEGDLKCFTE